MFGSLVFKGYIWLTKPQPASKPRTVAIGMKGAGMFGENIDKIANEHGLSYFFWMLTVISIVVALFSVAMTPVIKKLMHGVR